MRHEQERYQLIYKLIQRIVCNFIPLYKTPSKAYKQVQKLNSVTEY